MGMNANRAAAHRLLTRIVNNLFTERTSMLAWTTVINDPETERLVHELDKANLNLLRHLNDTEP